MLAKRTVIKKHIINEKVRNVQTPAMKKRISTKLQLSSVDIPKKIKKEQTPVDTKKPNARELLIMLKFRPEIIARQPMHHGLDFEHYLAFLVVKGIEQDFNTMRIAPPSAVVDSWWHSHILDTEAYHRTCVFLFGQYVHHKPHVKIDIQKKQMTYWAAHTKHFRIDNGDGDGDDVVDPYSSESSDGVCCA